MRPNAGESKKMSFRQRTAVLQRYVSISIFVGAASLSSWAHAAPLAIGAVYKVDARTSTVTILGQKYSVANTKLVAGKKTFAAIQGLSLLSPEALVWVDGELNKDGSAKVASLTVLPDRNIPGASQVFVAGLVK